LGLTVGSSSKEKPTLTRAVTVAVDMRYVTRYSTGMIRWIRHKGLKRLHEDDDSRGVIREHAEKLRDILARLDAAGTIADMDVPGFRLHPLKGEYEGYWAVTVRANWRVIFRFADRDVLDVDYVDYH
jgi:proteic killer suppression protein